MQVLDQLFSFCLVLFIPFLSQSWVFPFTLLCLGTDLRARIWPKDKPLHTCIALLVPGVCKADSLKAAPATRGRPEPAVGKPSQALRGELGALPLSQVFSRVSWSLSPPTSYLLALLSVLFFSLRRYGLGAHSKISLHWKRPWCWERLRAGGEVGNRGWDDWMASLTQWPWIWANSRR